jgi:hypothetical protein
LRAEWVVLRDGYRCVFKLCFDVEFWRLEDMSWCIAMGSRQFSLIGKMARVFQTFFMDSITYRGEIAGAATFLHSE